MSPVMLAGAVAGLLAAAVAVLGLWRAAQQHTGHLRHAYRWFTAAVVLSFGNLLIAGTVPLGGNAAMMLSFADLPALALLPVMAAGLTETALARRRDQPFPSRHSRPERGAAWAYLADGYILAAAMFLLGWLALFGGTFTRSGENAATFAGELIHPLADLAFIAGTLVAAAMAGRRAIAPYLALVAITVSDFLAVGARVSGTRPGIALVVAQLAAFGLFALTPRGLGWLRREASWLGDGRGVTASVAAAAAVLAGLLLGLQAVVTGHLPRPVVLFILGSTVVVLGTRVVALVWRVNAWSQLWQESGRDFRQLADRTSDVVLLCDPGGVIRYASPAVTGYGYTPESLHGVSLDSLLHPEDREGGMRAVRRAVTGPAQRVGRYACRVRAADGTWRHVESSISRYRDPERPDQLLITARDVSAQVALRRQVTHLRFHDSLTGLPNRAYMEQRAHDALGPVSRAVAAAVQPGDAASPAPAAAAVAGVIIVDVDNFTAVNDAVGHGAGDLLLAQVARRLRLAVAAQDVVARWGDDEFAILLEGAGSAEEITDAAHRLARTVSSEAFGVGEADVSLTASVGVAFADGSPAGHVWRNAELAVAQAKEGGRGRVEVFGAVAAPSEPLAGAPEAAGQSPGEAITGQPRAAAR